MSALPVAFLGALGSGFGPKLVASKQKKKKEETQTKGWSGYAMCRSRRHRSHPSQECQTIGWRSMSATLVKDTRRLGLRVTTLNWEHLLFVLDPYLNDTHNHLGIGTGCDSKIAI